jgi:hypothetical protein
MWDRLVGWFGLEPVPFSGKIAPLVKQMADARPIWADLARRHKLVEPDLDRVSSFWHTNGDLLRPFKCITDMTKSRQLGFGILGTKEKTPCVHRPKWRMV